MRSYRYDGTHCMACGVPCFRKLCCLCRANAALATAHMSDGDVERFEAALATVGVR